MKLFLITLILTGIWPIESKTQQLRFIAKYGAENLNRFPNRYLCKNGDTIEFSVLKFYISNPEFRKNGITVYKPKQQYYLVDFGMKHSTILNFEVPNKIKYDELLFNIGIDSATNCGGAMGGALDPTLGMYWTWQNGYIHFKLEGKSSRCLSRNHQFEFHIGGYKTPFNTLQKITIPTQTSKQITIEIDLSILMDSIDLATLHHIMSPCHEAVKFSEKFPYIFYPPKR
jgi:hypothetical protein